MDTDAFLELLSKSGLVSDDKLDDALTLMEDTATPHQLADAEYVGKTLVDQGIITPWHLRQLLKRRYKGFFIRQYKILGLLGAGGMSTVYLAEHTLMQRRVAIKVLPKERLKKSAYLDHFVREAQVIATLDHPNIIRAYDIDREDDIHYIVMEFFEGLNLQKKVETEGPLAVPDIVRYVLQAAEALSYAHKIGIVHRDVKPGNLLVNSKNQVKLLDLGLAMIDQRLYSGNISSNFQESSILGTADYLAPEQAMNSQKIDSRADIYALGGVLYFCLTGHPPFPSGSISERLLAHQQKEPKSILLDRPNTAKDLVAICEKMMAKNPCDRQQSADEVIHDLQNWLIDHKQADPNEFKNTSVGFEPFAPVKDVIIEESTDAVDEKSTDNPEQVVDVVEIDYDSEDSEDSPTQSVQTIPVLPSGIGGSIPAIPTIPSVPKLPSLPSLPDNVKTAPSPTIPHLPPSLGTDNTPTLPTLPALPSGSDSPKLPQLSTKSDNGVQTEEISTLPKLPSIPTVPGQPTIPVIPTLKTPPILPPTPTKKDKPEKKEELEKVGSEIDEFLTRSDEISPFGTYDDDSVTSAGAGPLVFGDNNDFRVDLNEQDYDNSFGMKTDIDLSTHEEIVPLDDSILNPDSSMDLSGKTDVDLNGIGITQQPQIEPEKKPEPVAEEPKKPEVEPEKKPEPVVEEPKKPEPQPEKKQQQSIAKQPPKKPQGKPPVVETKKPPQPQPQQEKKQGPVKPEPPKQNAVKKASENKPESAIKVNEQIPLGQQPAGPQQTSGQQQIGMVRTPPPGKGENQRVLPGAAQQDSAQPSKLTEQEKVSIRPPDQTSVKQPAPKPQQIAKPKGPEVFPLVDESDDVGIFPIAGENAEEFKEVVKKSASGKSQPGSKPGQKKGPMNDDDYDQLLTNFVTSQLPVKKEFDDDPAVLLAMAEMEREKTAMEQKPQKTNKPGNIPGMKMKAPNKKTQEDEYDDASMPTGPVAIDRPFIPESWIASVPLWFWTVFGFAVVAVLLLIILLVTRTT